MQPYRLPWLDLGIVYHINNVPRYYMLTNMASKHMTVGQWLAHQHTDRQHRHRHRHRHRPNKQTKQNWFLCGAGS